MITTKNEIVERMKRGDKSIIVESPAGFHDLTRGTLEKMDDGPYTARETEYEFIVAWRQPKRGPLA